MHGRICVIGLGTMGRPMAGRLGSAGCDLAGWDSDAEARKGMALASLEETALEAGTVITMLPDGESVASVVESLLEQRDDRIFLDCSSIDVATTRHLAEMAVAAGCGFVDAPVSGGPEGARDGTLSFMVGGRSDHVARVRPLLDIMGRRIVHFGETGSGQAAKACHNMICGITAMAVLEGFALAEALGLDPAKFYQLCAGAAAQCWTLENRCPIPGVVPEAPASNGYAPGFAARLMAKDLRLAQAASEATGQPTPFGAEAARAFSEFAEANGGGLDFSSYYTKLRVQPDETGND